MVYKWYVELRLMYIFPVFQRSIYLRLLKDKNSELFFKVFYDKMVKASEEIKSLVMVNTSDGEKRVDEQKDLQHKDATGGLKRGRGMASF